MLKLAVFLVVIPAFVLFLDCFILTSWFSGSLSCLYLLMPTVGTICWSNLVFAPIPPMLMPRITFAHGTSPFTIDQLKLGRAGEPKGWNGHGGLKVLCLLCLTLFVFISKMLFLIIVKRISSFTAGGWDSLNKEPLIFSTRWIFFYHASLKS